MQKRVVIRRTRIAASIFLGMLTALLYMLGVRSYWWANEVIDRYPLVGGVLVQSSRGGLAIRSLRIPENSPLDEKLPMYTRTRVLSAAEMNSPQVMNSTGVFAPEYCGFGLRVDSFRDWRIATPYWFLFLATGLIGAVIWPKTEARRFSLASLMIATTLVAVMLGLGAWLTR